MKMKKRIFAIDALAEATPRNPSAPAIREMTRKIIAQYSMAVSNIEHIKCGLDACRSLRLRQKEDLNG